MEVEVEVEVEDERIWPDCKGCSSLDLGECFKLNLGVFDDLEFLPERAPSARPRSLGIPPIHPVGADAPIITCNGRQHRGRLWQN